MDRSQRKDIYLDDLAERGIATIIEKGYALNLSAAARVAIVQFAAMITAPRVTPTTP